MSSSRRDRRIRSNVCGRRVENGRIIVERSDRDGHMNDDRLRKVDRLRLLDRLRKVDRLRMVDRLRLRKIKS